MLAIVYKGQLTYVNTDKGQIQIEDLIDGQSTSLHIDDDTNHCVWERLIGSEVEVIVIDDKTTQVNVIEDN